MGKDDKMILYPMQISILAKYILLTEKITSKIHNICVESKPGFLCRPLSFMQGIALIRTRAPEKLFSQGNDHPNKKVHCSQEIQLNEKGQVA